MINRRSFIESVAAVGAVCGFDWKPTETSIKSLSVQPHVWYQETIELGKRGPYGRHVAFPIVTDITVEFKNQPDMFHEFESFNLTLPEHLDEIHRNCDSRVPLITTSIPELIVGFDRWNEEWKDVENIPEIRVSKHIIKLKSIWFPPTKRIEGKSTCNLSDYVTVDSSTPLSAVCFYA